LIVISFGPGSTAACSASVAATSRAVSMLMPTLQSAQTIRFFSLEQTDRLFQLEAAVRALEMDHIGVDIGHDESCSTIFDGTSKYFPVPPTCKYLFSSTLYKSARNISELKYER
jgi:hypothetical protein